MPKKPNVALGLRFLIAYEERGEGPADRAGLEAVEAAKAWIKSLPPIVTEDDLRRHDDEMESWRKSLRSSLKRCVSQSGSVSASVVIGHATPEQKRVCLEEAGRVARLAGVRLTAVVKKDGERLTIELSGDKDSRFGPTSCRVKRTGSK